MSNLFRISCWRIVILFVFLFFLKIWDGSYGILGLTRIFPESRLQIAKSLGTCLFLMKNIFAYINRLNVCHWIKQIKLMHPPPLFHVTRGCAALRFPCLFCYWQKYIWLISLINCEVKLLIKEMGKWFYDVCFKMQLSIVITGNKLGISNIFLLSSCFFLCLKYTHDCVYQVSVLQGYLHLLWYLPYAFTVAVFFLSRACTTHSCFQCCCIFAIWWYKIKVVDVKMSDLIKLFIIYTHQLSLLDTDSFTECDPTFRNTSLWVSESITNL